jgi:hypothetical protein
MLLQLEARITRHAEVARTLVKDKQHSKALVVLKKKKMSERQLEELSALQLNMETMVRVRVRGGARQSFRWELRNDQ